MKKTNGSKITILCILAALTVLCAFVLTGCVQKGYKLTYNLDGAVYSESTVKAGSDVIGIVPEVRNGYVFDGWKDLPKTMPENDVTVYGTTSLEDKKLVNTFESKLTMGEGMSLTMYLSVSGDGKFVFSRSTDFSSTEKGAGSVEKDGNGYYLAYTVVNGETVNPDEYKAYFDFTDEKIAFTSTMWFGSTTPRIADGEGYTYPVFEVSGGEEPVTEFRTGTYYGTLSKQAMGTQIDYEFYFIFNEDRTYSYHVEFVMGGETYEQDENGVYEVVGTAIAIIPEGVTERENYITGAVTGEGKATVTRKISTFATKADTVEITLGAKPEPQPEPETFELKTNKYIVDITWSPMASMFKPMLDVNAEEKTFKVYNESDAETLKGNGRISLENGVYTLFYEAGSTTTFTYDKETEVITFTSPLVYGKAMFNRLDDDGNFVPYTAAVASEAQPEPEPEPEPNFDLKSAKYIVDISWSPMADMFTPVLEIDAENKTFKLYNKADPDTLKGEGTITLENGVYTLVYEDSTSTSTFTFDYETDTITFTSPLHYGAAMFNRVQLSGEFIPYTAKPEIEG